MEAALAERVARAINDRSLLKPRRAKTALADVHLRLDATLGPFLTVTAGVTNGVWAMNVHTKAPTRSIIPGAMLFFIQLITRVYIR
jgi:hypothetical protein